MKFRRFLSVLIALCICVSMFTTVASAATVDGAVSAPAFPTATVDKLTNVPTNVQLSVFGENGVLQPTAEKVSKLGTAYTFTADEVSEETFDYYKNWRCDFIVTFDQDIEAGTFGLYGKYGDYEIAFVYPEDIHAGDKINLVESSGLGKLDYDYIKNTVGTFTCGAFNLDSANARKRMTVELCLWEDDDQAASPQRIAIKSYGFGDLGKIVRPDLPTATVEKLTNVPTNVKLSAFDEKGELQPAPEKVSKLGAAYIFTADDVSDETFDYYKNWRCDYIVTFEDDIPAGTFGLYGKYGDYEIAFVYPEDIHAGETINLVESSGLGKLDYDYIKNTVGTFTCGAFNLDEANHGKTMKVNLVIWKDGEKEETEEILTKNVYNFGDLATLVEPELPVAIVEKIAPEENAPVYVMTDVTDPTSIVKTGSVTNIEEVYLFTLNPEESEATSEYYKDWLCDFKVTFNKNIPANTFGLYGSYGDYNIAFVYPYDIHTGDHLYLLDLIKVGDWSYDDIKNFVREFKCGAFNLSEVNRNKGKLMDVDLVMWPPETDPDADGTTTVAHEVYDFGDLTTINVTIAASAKDANGNPVAATVSGGGDFNVGTQVTLTANPASGYSFQGWYLDGEKVSDGADYTFTALADAEYTAVYASVGDGILTVTADDFTIAFNGGAAGSGYGTQNYNKPVGTAVELNYPGDDFLYWVNSSYNIVSRDPNYSFVLVGTTDLYAVSSGDVQETETAYVVFHNAYDQVMQEARYNAFELEDQFPSVAPGKMGGIFKRWVIEDTQEEVSSDNYDAIISRMSATENVTIHVVPEYESVTGTYSVSVVIKDGDTTETVYTTETAIGEPTNITKEKVAQWSENRYEASQFGFFSIDGGNTAVTYGDMYTVISGANGTEIVVTAVVADAAEAEPVVLITEMFAAENGSGYKVSSTMRYFVPDNCTVREAGFVYSRSTDDPAKLTLDNVGNDNVKKHLSAYTESSGIYTMNINTNHSDRVFNVVAFIIYQDENGSIHTMYSDVASGSYATLNG